MEFSDADAPAIARPRIVMIVDNHVDGDSRVQKAARSAAAAGWEVILLGRATSKEARTWKIGDAEVRLLPMRRPMAKRPHQFRRHWLLTPLAYPPTGIAARRRQEMRAWFAHIAMRHAERQVNGGGSKISGAWLRAERLAAKITRKWVGLRSRQLVRGQEIRRRLATPIDRLYTRFWQLVLGDGAWRKLEPILWDFELAYGPAIDKLKPDLIHANDFRMLGVGARAKIRARAKGHDIKLVWDAHEFLPGIHPWEDNARWLLGNAAHERLYAHHADAVMTVSTSLAELLQRNHKLDVLPYVVLNAPDVELTASSIETPPDIRVACGIGPDTPLFVYSGAAAEKRGIGVMIEAMPKLPEAHVALVVGKVNGIYVSVLRKRAGELGVADRLHVLPYVPHWQVTPFLSGASIGVIPIRHYPNHEIALITKFFEYSHARLPIVVSDVRTMAEMVGKTGQGEVFRVDDVDDYVRAVSAVLADRERYVAAYDAPGLLDGWTWAAQADILNAVYRQLLPEQVSPVEPKEVAAV